MIKNLSVALIGRVSLASLLGSTSVMAATCPANFQPRQTRVDVPPGTPAANLASLCPVGTVFLPVSPGTTTNDGIDVILVSQVQCAIPQQPQAPAANAGLSGPGRIGSGTIHSPHGIRQATGKGPGGDGTSDNSSAPSSIVLAGLPSGDGSTGGGAGGDVGGSSGSSGSGSSGGSGGGSSGASGDGSSGGSGGGNASGSGNSGSSSSSAGGSSGGGGSAGGAAAESSSTSGGSTGGSTSSGSEGQSGTAVKAGPRRKQTVAQASGIVVASAVPSSGTALAGQKPLATPVATPPLAKAVAPAVGSAITTKDVAPQTVRTNEKRVRVPLVTSEPSAIPASIGSTPGPSRYLQPSEYTPYAGKSATIAQPSYVSGWATGSYDREKQTNLGLGLDRGNSSHSITTGSTGAAGLEWSSFRGNRSSESVTLGVFSGYSNYETSNNGTSFSQTDADGYIHHYTAGSQQTSDGGFVGVNGRYVVGGLSVDGLVKVDIFSLNSRQSLTETIENPVDAPGCRYASGAAPYQRDVTTTDTSYIMDGNLSYRFDLAHRWWIEPTIGARYTITNYGGGAGRLGLADGEVLRLQGGATVGTAWDGSHGWIWSTALTGLVYSNVDISGFSPVGILSGTSSDERRLQGLGRVTLTATDRNGLSLFVQGEVRGAENYTGASGRAGLKLQW
jgi:hypothetical protein